MMSDPRVSQILEIMDKGHGNINSFNLKKSINSKNEPIPWFTYPAIEYLSQLDYSDCLILEWGLGNSTLFFAERCKHILSIEHNPEWYHSIVPLLPENATGVLVSETEYSTYPKFLQIPKYDIIIIDGINRDACIDTAIDLINEGGMIILDNSDRNPEYCQKLREYGLIEVDFHGFGPIVSFTTTTSIFLDRHFNLCPQTIQPKIPIGGGY